MDSIAEPLSIQDLIRIREALDLAAVRGCFRAGEMQNIGQIYNRLDQFIRAASRQIQNSTPDIQGDNP